MDCIFCNIVNETIPSYTIFEDDIVKCFLDVNPESNGHMLIIPKKHFKDLDEIDLNTLNRILEIAKDLKKLLEDKLKIDGLTLVQNNGVVQEVKHYHLHLKPFYNKKQELLPVKDIYEILKSN